jgi:hypothetical protein
MKILLKILEILPELCKDCFFCRRQKEEVMFMNRSVNYFAKDQFEETNFFLKYWIIRT